MTSSSLHSGHLSICLLPDLLVALGTLVFTPSSTKCSALVFHGTTCFSSCSFTLCPSTSTECSSYNVTLSNSYTLFLPCPSLLSPNFQHWWIFCFSSIPRLSWLAWLAWHSPPSLALVSCWLLLQMSPRSHVFWMSSLPPPLAHIHTEMVTSLAAKAPCSTAPSVVLGSFLFLTRQHQQEQSPCSRGPPQNFPLGWAIQRTCPMSEWISLHLFFDFSPASFPSLKSTYSVVLCGSYPNIT